MDGASVLARVGALAAEWAGDRTARLRRRELVREDFDRLREAGYLLTGVPVAQGGLWESVPRSTRLVAELLRTLASGDPSVALVCSMHPSVLSFWLAMPVVDAPLQAAWDEQRRSLSQTAIDGHWWGTITSEPGSGGDMTKTKSTARPAGDGAAYRIAGQKHFGSGSGMTSFMITTARPVGDDEPDLFLMDVRDTPWDGSTGLTLTAAWDGQGMTATQSHAFLFDGFPATRVAWPGHLRALSAAAAPFVGSCFTAVIVGVVETAVATARAQLSGKQDSLRPYERVEWTRVELDAWLIRQAYDGMLRAVEAEDEALLAVLRGKTAIAELAESVLARLSRVIGGGSYARSSPFGFWAQDVRALGFLRPPWGLAFDVLYDTGWPES